MAVRSILQIGDPALRRPAEQVDVSTIHDTGIQQVIDDLVDTMRSAGGAGLAATQIGVPLHIAVMEVTKNKRYPYKPPIPLTVAINAAITPLDTEQVEINEGCLSVPLRGIVRRYVNIKVEYVDRNGQALLQECRGLTAGTWQHEIDHLDGVLFIDRVDDPKTLSTWEEFTNHHREAFTKKMVAFVERVGS